MAYFLVLVSLFIKQIVPSISMYYLSEIPFYVYLLFCSWIVYQRIKNKNQIAFKQFDSKVLLCTISVLFLQLLALYWSYFHMQNDDLVQNPASTFCKIIILVGIIVVHYLAVGFAVTDKISIYRFVKGNGIALLLLLIISYIQLLYLILPNLMNHVVAAIGFLENRYDRDWYNAGSYIQTMHRINGLNPESDYLAVQLLVVFVPFLLASIKNKVNVFLQDRPYNAVVYYSVLFSVIIILFFAKTSTGILAILMIAITLWLMIPKKKKLYMGLLFLIGIIILYLCSWFIQPIKEIIDVTLINKMGGDSMMTRIVGTYGLFITWLKNPILGVGFNNHDFYIYKYISNSILSISGEYRTVFAPQHFFPILSAFFGWLAEFGITFVVFLIVYVYKLLKDFRIMAEQFETKLCNDHDKKMFMTIKDAAHYFFIYYSLSSLLIFNWYESIYLINIFFFVIARRYFRRELSITSKMNNNFK